MGMQQKSSDKSSDESVAIRMRQWESNESMMRAQEQVSSDESTATRAQQWESSNGRAAMGEWRQEHGNRRAVMREQ